MAVGEGWLSGCMATINKVLLLQDKAMDNPGRGYSEINCVFCAGGVFLEGRRVLPH